MIKQYRATLETIQFLLEHFQRCVKLILLRVELERGVNFLQDGQIHHYISL